MPGKGKPFVKGEAKGRPKGTLNKATKDAKEIFNSIMEAQIPDINTALNALKKNPKDYLDCLSKLMPYFLTKKIDISSNDEKVETIVVQRQIITKSTDEYKTAES